MKPLMKAFCRIGELHLYEITPGEVGEIADKAKAYNNFKVTQSEDKEWLTIYFYNEEEDLKELSKCDFVLLHKRI